MGKVWTKEELDFHKSHIGRTSLLTIAEHLGRTPIAVNIKIQRLGLGRTK